MRFARGVTFQREVCACYCCGLLDAISERDRDGRTDARTSALRDDLAEIQRPRLDSVSCSSYTCNQRPYRGQLIRWMHGLRQKLLDSQKREQSTESKVPNERSPALGDSAIAIKTHTNPSQNSVSLQLAASRHATAMNSPHHHCTVTVLS